MKDKETFDLIDESIKLELNISKIYSIFYKIFPKHRDFWWEMEMEEMNHAALLRSIKHHYQPIEKIPDDLLPKEMNDLKKSNTQIEALLDKFNTERPTDIEAFNLALKLEQSVGEIHYQNFMSNNSNNDENDKISEIFKKLNGDDMDHSDRISNYMEKNGIQKVEEK